MTLKYNKKILRRNLESNKKGDLRTPKNIIATVERINLRDKLEIDDSIDLA